MLSDFYSHGKQLISEDWGVGLPLSSAESVNQSSDAPTQWTVDMVNLYDPTEILQSGDATGGVVQGLSCQLMDKESL